MVCWLWKCCAAEHPIMIPEVNQFQTGFVGGEASLMLDLQGLLHDKSPGFPGWTVQTSRKLIATYLKHPWKNPLEKRQGWSMPPRLKTVNLRCVGKDLNMAWPSPKYTGQTRSWHAALQYHHLVDHAKRRRVQAREAVDSLFRGTPPRF